MKLKSTFVGAVVLAAAMGVAEAKDSGKPGEYDVHDCRNKQCQDVNPGNGGSDNGHNGNDGSQANNGGNGKGYGYGYGGQGGQGGNGGVGQGGNGGNGYGQGGNSDSHSNSASNSKADSKADSKSNSNANAHGGNANADGGKADANANAQGGNANANGGKSDATANAQGGQGGRSDANANANAHGGQGGQANAAGGNVGDVNVSNSTTTHFNAAKQVGIAPDIYLNQNSDCGEGWSISTGFIGGSIGGGRTTQNEECLSQKAAQAIMNTGLVRGDDGMIAGGLRTLANLHSEIDQALETIGNNMIECADAPKPASIVLLAQKTPYCKPKM